MKILLRHSLIRVCTVNIYAILSQTFIEPASVTQSDASPTGDQEVMGSMHAGSGNILSRRLIMKMFSTVILSLLLIQVGQLSVSGERMCTSTG